MIGKLFYVIIGERIEVNVRTKKANFLEKEGMLIDIPGEAISVAGVPTPPPGLTVDRVDVVVRVKRA